MNAVTEPLVSIIVPIYNVEKYLDQCVASLIQQTHHNIEILLIDDGSPDNAPAICDAWQHKDERVHVLHKTNSGVSASRNAGLHAAKGEYVCFVDGDDWVEPDFVEYMLELQAKRNADIVACCVASPARTSTRERRMKCLLSILRRQWSYFSIPQSSLERGINCIGGASLLPTILSLLPTFAQGRGYNLSP